MKLATFTQGGAPELGVVLGDSLVPISRQAPGLGRDMIGLIAHWEDAEREVRALAEAARDTLPLADVTLLAPVRRPGKIMAIGLNYADHIAESGMETPAEQVWFSKAVTCVNGPFSPVDIPRVSDKVDYEAELVAVVGKGGRHISEAAAPSALFGWCVGNDVTERLWQHRTPQWVVGKSFDTHAPIGPWIVTRDELPDPHGLAIRCHVNGALRQDSNTRHLIFDVWAQVAHLSAAMTLEAGDLIFTGTPGGIGATMNPRQFLKAGDVVRVEIEGLGAIENPFAPEPG